MKKFLSLLLVFALALTLFVACNDNGGKTDDDGDEKTDGTTEDGGNTENGGNVEGLEELAGKTPEELYAETVAKLASYTLYKAQTTQEIVMSVQGQSFTMIQEVTSVVDGQNSYFRSYAENIDGSAIVNEGYYVDGVLYNATNKLKVELPYEDYVRDYLGGAEGESLLLNIPESWFSDIRFVENEGLYSLVFTIAGDKYEEFFSKTGLVETATEISDVIYTVNFDKDAELVDIVTEFSMNISGVDATVTSTSKIILEDIPSITPPADADSYREGVLN